MRELKFRTYDFVMQRYDDAPEMYATTDGHLEPSNNKIIEQYTMLKDKNGKEIYEGDIVKCYYYGRMIGIYQVIRNEDIAGYEMEAIEGNPENEDIKDIRSFAEMHLFTRVIGNIHENRELLGDTNVTNKEEG